MMNLRITGWDALRQFYSDGNMWLSTLLCKTHSFFCCNFSDNGVFKITTLSLCQKG